MKDNWVLNNAESVIIRPAKEVYPVHLICHGHKYIKEIEIPNANYIKVKYRGKWVELYLPIDAS